MAHARADNRYTRGLAEFVSGLRYERIPEEVRARLKLLMLDSLGCALFGAGLEWSRILRRTLAAVDTSRGVHPLGHGRAAVGAACGAGERHRGAGLRARRRASPGRAACRRRHAAGAVRRRRDDGRPGRRPLSGRDLLRAAVAGYEVGPRVGMCMGQEHIGQGWHSGATVGVFSAAAGAAPRSGSAPSRRCTRSASPARSRPG